MMLAEKLREDDQRLNVLQIINEACQTKLDPLSLYEMPQLQQAQVSSVQGGDLRELVSLQESLRAGSVTVPGVNGVAVTSTLRRLWKLLGRCIANNEPALLIGGTGSGKTTVCQLMAAHRGQHIRILNCHQSTETADIIGGLRPVRGRPGILRQFVESAGPSLTDLIENFVSNKSVLVAQNSEDIDGLFDRLLNEIQIARQAQSESFQSTSSISEDDQASSSSSEGNMIDDALAKKYYDALETCVGTAERIRELLTAQQSASMTTEEVEPAVDSHTSSKKKARKSSNVSTAASAEPINAAAVSAVNGILSAFSADIKTAWSRYRSLFEWHDGPLVRAMKDGDIFLLDEINLAEDAVIERLNSVLESGRTLTLAERGGGDIETERIVAHPNFKFLATMNPGGDYGKRELSPALRSRFTESFVQEMLNEEDVILILCEIMAIKQYFQNNVNLGATVGPEIATVMYRFMRWLNEKAAASTSSLNVIISVREILAWASFVSNWMKIKSENTSPSDVLDSTALASQVYVGMLHGAFMVLLDGLGIGSTSDRESINTLKAECLQHLLSRSPASLLTLLQAEVGAPSAESIANESLYANELFTLGSFSVSLGPLVTNLSRDHRSVGFVVESNNTVTNLWRVMRAMQIGRPILLEGPPVSSRRVHPSTSFDFLHVSFV
jgi:midasin (ATPase involved in ribosome maturation)